MLFGPSSKIFDPLRGSQRVIGRVREGVVSTMKWIHRHETIDLRPQIRVTSITRPYFVYTPLVILALLHSPITLPS